MIRVIERRHCILTLCVPHNQLQRDCCPAEHNDCDFTVYLQPDLLGSAKDGNQTCQAAWVGDKTGSNTRYMSVTYVQAVVIRRRNLVPAIASLAVALPYYTCKFDLHLQKAMG